MQAANWNAYRQKLASTAVEAPSEETKSAARGKITTSVEDKAAGKEPPKVLHVTQETDVFEVPSPFALSEAELPDHLTDKVNRDGEIVHVQLQQLFRAVPCATKDEPPAALRFLGYVRSLPVER